jgi:hypothetical protein
MVKMIKTFTFNFIGLKPMSINKAYASNFKTKQRHKSKEYAIFSNSVYTHFLEQANNRTAKDFASVLGSINSLKIGIVVITPKKKVFKADGQRSAIVGDLGNFEKALTDCVFHILGVNDCLIDEINVKREIALDDKYSLVYKIEVN